MSYDKCYVLNLWYDSTELYYLRLFWFYFRLDGKFKLMGKLIKQEISLKLNIEIFSFNQKENWDNFCKRRKLKLLYTLIIFTIHMKRLLWDFNAMVKNTRT